MREGDLVLEEVMVRCPGPRRVYKVGGGKTVRVNPQLESNALFCVREEKDDEVVEIFVLPSGAEVRFYYRKAG